MDPTTLRQSYLDFFEQRDHRIVPSSPVIPHGDPTLLFTNAGMNQFKDVLLGREVRDYKRAGSVQKCIRAGGKHNDLDEVGKDGRHLTCFEMLGNWSFGDYYKREAIAWAWEYVTEILELDPSRLYVSVYKDDDESYSIWRDEVGLTEDRITRFGDVDAGDEENFWSMGPTGPCGPCTEIFWDHHPELGDVNWGVGFDEERIRELWNLVFMEFDRADDGTLSPLPMKSVDTGMGLERTMTVLDDVENIFETQIFAPILLRTAELLGEPVDDLKRIHARDDFSAFAVIADHVRAICFSLADGGMFSNEGRGYVLRRILRRAVRFGRMLGFRQPFLCEIAPVMVAHFGDAYPELKATSAEIAEMIRIEEERFFKTIDRGIARFNELADSTRQAGKTVIDGAEAFKLYDTYGFPLDLTQIMAEELGLEVDTGGFAAALKVQQERARSSDMRYEDAGEWLTIRDGVADKSVAWQTTRHRTRILRLREHSQTGQWEVLLAETPFYAEAGGEIGDTGTIRDVGGHFEFAVTNTVPTPSGLTHFAELVSGSPTLENLKGDVLAEVDATRRFLITCNHTATHLLHAALHDVVSDKAFQAGSLVAPDRLRFDYSFNRPLTDDEITALEDHVNARIQAAIALRIHRDVRRQDAEAMGAMAIFGEKYGETVRVVEVPGHSVELCGGCHVENTRDIAFFRIVSETGIAAGVRRIEAVTNLGAFQRAREDQRMLADIAALLKGDVAGLPERVSKLVDEQHQLQRNQEKLARRLAEIESQSIAEQARVVDGVTVGSARVNASNRNELLFYIDSLRTKLPEQATVLLGAVIDDKPALACLVTDPLFKSRGLKAGDLINAVAHLVGGRGGGRPTLAQAGGSKLEALGEAIEAFPEKVQQRLQNR